MFHKKITINETNHLEQVFVDSAYGLFQASIMLTNFSINLFENSRETAAKNRHSLQYQINYEDIIDIRLRDPKEFQEEVFVLPKTSQLLADPCFQKKTCHVLRIYFRESKSQRDCDILSNADSCVHRQIISHWQSFLHLESLALLTELCESQYTLAHSYYMETLSSLKISVNIVDKIDILRELGQELVTDITLKEICFSSRELVIVLFSICDEVISESKVQIKQKKSYYDEKRLRATEIQQRLELFHSVLYVFCCLFFMSECIDRRFDTISGSMSPLVLQSWIELTTVDIHKRICTVFDYSFAEDNEDILDEVDYEIDASFDTVAVLTPREIFESNFSPVPVRSSFTERMRTNSLESPRLRARTNSISRSNSIVRQNSIIDPTSADVLTPLRKRIETQVVEQKLLKKYNLRAITQSIRDLQALLASYICNSIYVGRPILRNIDRSPEKNYAEKLISYLGWEEFLESVLNRISDILDDMLALETIASRVKNRLRAKVLLRDYSRSLMTQKSILKFSPRDRVESDASDISALNMTYVIEDERKRIPPSPTKPGRQRKEPNLRNLKGEVNVTTVFETQEHLLFHFCNFLYLLCQESPRIRYFLFAEMEGAWFSIMHSLNLIIPRPDEDQMEMKSKLSSPSPNSSQPNPNPSSSFLKNLFQSEDSDVEEGEDHAIKDPDLNISIKERNQLYPPLLLKDYGKPVYKHLSRSSWELLLNSRYFLEEIVRHLGLEVSIVTHLPIADEDDSIEDLDIKPKTTTHTPWTLDSSIPRSHPPSTQTTAKPQIHSKTKDSLPPMNPPAPLPTHSPNIKNRKTIQQRLQSATNIPYHSNNENRFRKNQH